MIHQRQIKICVTGSKRSTYESKKGTSMTVTTLRGAVDGDRMFPTRN